MTQEERDAKAVELLTAAGYGPDNPLTLDYIYNTSEAHKAIIVAVSQMWKEKLGVNIDMSDMEFAVLLDRRHVQDYELARNAWCGDYNEASTFLGAARLQVEQNDQGWANAEVDKLLADAKLAADPNPMYTADRSDRGRGSADHADLLLRQGLHAEADREGLAVRERRAELVRQGHVHDRRVSV